MILTLDSPVICSTDVGLASIKDPNHPMPYEPCLNYKDVAEFRDWTLSAEARQFKTIVYDDVTEIAEMRLRLELSQTTHGQQAYGKMADEMMAFLRFQRAIENHVVVLIFKETRIQDQNKALVYSPMVPGKALNPMIPYLFGQIYRMESATDPSTQQSYPVIRCNRNDQCEAKDRSGKLNELEQAHLGNIISKVLS